MVAAVDVSERIPPAPRQLAPPPQPIVVPEPGPVRVVVDGLTIHFGRRLALQDVSVELCAGQTVSVVGPNGAGKSTLLKTIAGMLAPSHGSVRIDQAETAASRRQVVYVPQRSGVDWTFPVSVLDVVLMGSTGGRWFDRLRPFGAPARREALVALDRVGMAGHARVQIGELSGGQQQRVFLARALLQSGDVYLLDEPFTGVDAPTQELLIALFERLRAEGKTIVYATHDLAQASAASSRMLLVNRRLIADGPPAAVLNAANLRETFGGQAVILERLDDSQQTTAVRRKLTAAGG